MRRQLRGLTHCNCGRLDTADQTLTHSDSMQDAFAMLQLPRRPWLDEADVRSAFQRSAAQLHPDAVPGSSGDFAQLTRAYQILREPASRLRHLLELESPDTPVASGVPQELLLLFPIVARVRESIDRWTQRRTKAQSALQTALLDGDVSGLKHEANCAGEQLNQAMTAALAELRRLDAVWPSDSALRAAPTLQARLTFLEKWQAQLQEALLRLDIDPPNLH